MGGKSNILSEAINHYSHRGAVIIFLQIGNLYMHNLSPQQCWQETTEIFRFSIAIKIHQCIAKWKDLEFYRIGIPSKQDSLVQQDSKQDSLVR